PSAWAASGPGSICELAISGDGRRVAAFSYDRDSTAVYDLHDQRLIDTFHGYAQAMTICQDGERLAMSDGNDVVYWDIDQQEMLGRLCGHTSSIRSLHFSQDGRWLASGSKDRHIRVWDLAQ